MGIPPSRDDVRLQSPMESDAPFSPSREMQVPLALLALLARKAAKDPVVRQAPLGVLVKSVPQALLALLARKALLVLMVLL